MTIIMYDGTYKYVIIYLHVHTMFMPATELYIPAWHCMYMLAILLILCILLFIYIAVILTYYSVLNSNQSLLCS